MEKSFDRIKNKSAMIGADKKNKPILKDEYKKFEQEIQESIVTGNILNELDDIPKKPKTTQDFDR